MSSAAVDIVRHETEVAQALRRVYAKSKWEPSTDKTPLDVLMAAEDGTLDEWSYKSEVIRGVFEYFCQDGLEPWNVVCNVFAVAVHMHLPPWAHLTVRDRALLLGESHGNQHLRMQKICNLLRRSGARSWKAPGQKSLESRGEFSRAQQGNTNRKRKVVSRHRRLKRSLQKQKKHEA